jgi:hypothetical protein
MVFLVTVWSIQDQNQRDFAAFYAGARLWQANQSPYDHEKGCKIQSQIPVGVCLPNFHPPLLLPLQSLVSSADYLRSYYRWCAVLLAVLAGCMVLLYELTNRFDQSVALLAFFPMLFGFIQGQDSLFVLAGLLGFALCLRNAKDTLAGIALSLTVLRPTLAIALGLPLLLVNRKAFYSFFVFGLILVFYSWVLVGNQGFYDLFNGLLNSTHSDPTTRPETMYSIIGMLLWLGLNERLAWIAFVASIPLIATYWKAHGLTVRTFGMAIILAVFTSPHLHGHDLIVLIVPLIAWPSYAVLSLTLGFMITLQFGFSRLYVYLLISVLALTLRRERSNATIT